jgi:YegS/Rv2252/BmrU family lipid kinase
MTKRALLLVNRHARRGRQCFSQAVDLLNDLDFELISVPVKHPEQLAESIQSYGKQVDVVIIGGGDGTLNMAIESLLEVRRPLGILPLGTANDLARTLGIPPTLEAACQAIARGERQAIDLGWVNGKHFFNVASIGLSVEITRKLTQGAKRRWGIFAYALTALQALGQTRPFRCQLQCNGESIAVKTIQLAIGNGLYYGGGMAISSDAAIDDRSLDLYSLEIERWWQLFPLILTLPQGQHRQHHWVRTLRTHAVQISTRKPQPINTDGEITASTPAEFRVIPRAMEVCVPSSPDRSHKT